MYFQQLVLLKPHTDQNRLHRAAQKNNFLSASELSSILISIFDRDHVNPRIIINGIRLNECNRREIMCCFDNQFTKENEK